MGFASFYDLDEVLSWRLEGCTIYQAMIETSLNNPDCPQSILDLDMGKGELSAAIIVEGNVFIVILEKSD